MICLQPSQNNQLEPVLRTDGVYLSLTKDSYNLFRVVENDLVIVLGSYFNKFYCNSSAEPTIKIRGTGEGEAGAKRRETISVDRNVESGQEDVPLYQYLQLTDPRDVLLTATEVARLPQELLMVFKNGKEAFGGWILTQQIDCIRYQGATGIVQKPSIYCAYLQCIGVNSDYYLYIRNGEKRLIYGLFGDHPYVFVPLDLAHEDYAFARNHFNTIYR